LRGGTTDRGLPVHSIPKPGPSGARTMHRRAQSERKKGLTNWMLRLAKLSASVDGAASKSAQVSGQMARSRGGSIAKSQIRGIANLSLIRRWKRPPVPQLSHCRLRRFFLLVKKSKNRGSENLAKVECWRLSNREGICRLIRSAAVAFALTMWSLTIAASETHGPRVLKIFSHSKKDFSTVSAKEQSSITTTSVYRQTLRPSGQ